MGLFDGKIEELGETLVKGFDDRVLEIQKELESETYPGKSLLLKTTLVSLREVSLVIKSALIAK